MAIPIKPLLHSPLGDLFSKQQLRSEQPPKKDSIADWVGGFLDVDNASKNDMDVMNALYASTPLRGSIKPYADLEDYKSRAGKDYTNAIQGNLWAGGMVGGKYAPLFDLANAFIYHKRGMPGTRNQALFSSILPTIMPKKIPGANPISNFLNKYLVPKYGDDLIRDAVRGKSSKTFGERALSGNLGQPIYKPFVGKLMSNTRLPYTYSNVIKDVAENLGVPLSRLDISKGIYGQDIGKNLWKAIVKDERSIVGHITNDATIARHFLQREMYDLPLKPYIVPGTNKSILWDDVFKLAKGSKKGDDVFSVKGKLWEFNKKKAIGRALADEWDQKYYLRHRPGNETKKKHSVLGSYGVEGPKATLLPPDYDFFSPSSLFKNLPEVQLDDRMFDIWDFALNPGEKMFDSGTDLLRGLGGKLDLWDPVKVVQDIPYFSRPRIQDMELKKNIYTVDRTGHKSVYRRPSKATYGGVSVKPKKSSSKLYEYKD